MAPRCKKAGSVGVICPSGILQRDSMDEVCALAMDFMFTDIRLLVIDFHDVIALLSEGIRLLVNIHDKVEGLKKELRICNLPKEVHYTLKITNLLDFLGHKDSLSNILADAGIPESELRDFDPETGSASPRAAPSAPAPQDTQTAPAPARKPVDMPAKPAEASAPTPATSAKAAPPAPEAPSSSKPASFATGDSAGEELKRREKDRMTRLFGSIKTLGSQMGGKEPPAPKSSQEAKPASSSGTIFDKADLNRVVKFNIPSRVCFRIMRHFIERKKDTLAISDIAEAIQEKEKLIKKDLQRLVNRGMLKHLGGDVYNINVSPEVAEELQVVFRMYDTKETHSLVLGVLIANER